MVKQTEKHKVEVIGDLLTIRDLNNNIVKAIAIEGGHFQAVDKFNEMVAKVVLYESETKEGND
tara:strand:+ start:288 stop:476 length:189 start_codon:yes stop_codon:yes gene_type:complete